MPKTVIYSSNFCPFCYRAKALLSEKNVAFQEINVDGKPKVRAEMRKKAGGRNSVPQIFIDEKPIGGCDDLYALDAQGKLDKLLGQAA